MSISLPEGSVFFTHVKKKFKFTKKVQPTGIVEVSFSHRAQLYYFIKKNGGAYFFF